jgi:hypothetical protein
MAKTKTKRQPVRAKSAKAKKVPKRLAKFRPMNVVVAPDPSYSPIELQREIPRIAAN